MNVNFKDNILLLENNHTYSFNYPISEIMLLNDIIIVLLKIPYNIEVNYDDEHNVYGISKKSEKLWQIQPRPKGDDSVYTMIRVFNGKLFANDFMCRRYNVNEKTGKIQGDAELVK